MSEHDALVERVTAIIRPLHDRPAKRGEYLSEAHIHDTARAAIAAVRDAVADDVEDAHDLTFEGDSVGIRRALSKVRAVLGGNA